MIQNFIQGLMDYGFLRNAMITSVLVGTVSGVIGCFIILRGLSLMGDAISHAVLPGVAVSYMLGIGYFIGAALFGVLASILISTIGEKTKLKSDTSIGIVFSAFFALGIILISAAKSATDLYHILFGNVLAVRSSDIIITAVVGLFVLLFVLIFYKELKVSSFDPAMAKAYGLNTKAIHYGLMAALTLVAVAALQTVGTVLVIAMLITPAATAYLLTNRLSVMIFLAAGFGAAAAVIGLFFSYSCNLASGAAIVLTCAVFFICALLFSPGKGILFRKKVANHEENI